MPPTRFCGARAPGGLSGPSGGVGAVSPAPRPRVPGSYQAVVRVQAAVAAGLGDVGGVAQHPPVAGLVHPAGGAPRVAAVVAICNTGGDSAASGPR